MRTQRIDVPIIVYSLIILGSLIVSAPATYSLVSLFHSDGSTMSAAATVALLVLLELGAVASKLATLWAPEARRVLIGFCVGALSINTLSNLIHGGIIATGNGLHWFAAWVGAAVYAAFLPLLIFLMLSLVIRRMELLRGVQRSTADEVALILRPVVHAVAVAHEAQRSLATLSPAPALPEPDATYARAQLVAQPLAQPAQPVAALPSACPACGTEPTKMQQRTAKQHGGWSCKGCGKRVGAD